MPRKVPRRSYAKLHPVVDMPDFLEMQLKSWKDFLQLDVPPEARKNKGLQAVFQSVFPVTDVSEQYALEFVSYSVGRPKYSVEECKERGMTYQAPLRARLRLVHREPEENGFKVKEAIEQVVFLGDIPLMTEKGTFIINGVERVVVGQLHRSPGVFFSETIHPNGKPLYSARVVSYRGSWVEFSLDVHDVLFVHIERKRKLPATVLLRALGYSSDRDILELFLDVKEVPVGPGLKRWVAAEPVVGPDGQVLVQALEQLDEGHIQALQEAGVEKVAAVEIKGEGDRAVVIWNTLRKDPTKGEKEALYRIYSLLRPGEPPSVDMAKRFFESLFFNPKRYDLGVVGRYQINRRFELDIPLEHTTLDPKDFIAILDYLLALWEGKGTTDDIDHLGNRRVRTVGEQLANQFLVGLTRMARSVRERLSLKEVENPTPHDLVNARTVSAVVQSFFATSQLSQFMDGTNPLAELTNKRRLSALGPGGLTRRRAGFEVRDVHHTHYGRICPIETPEGPNIGLITSLSLYARVNDFGFIETPYRKVVKENGKVRVTDEIVYLTADQEDKYTIAQANAPLNPDGTFKNPYVRARRRGEFPLVPVEEVDFMDVSPGQLVSVSTSLIPFLEHDDANRALMGSNMQRQAVPLLKPEAPLVGTGIEEKVARDSRAMVTAETPGKVVRVTADEIVVKEDRDPQDLSLLGRSPYRVYKLIKFARSNAGTCINQRPIVRPGDRVEKGDVLADGPATDGGELALGANVLVAFMPWEGYNFEDAVVISERLCRDDVFTSVHIEEFELQVRDTKRGEEELTREIPNVGEDAVKNLDGRGIVRIGAEVHPGDILVGKVTPKGEVEPTPEEKLLRAIFGEKAKDVRDTSLRLPPGMEGVVVDTKLFSRKPRDERTRRRDQERIAEIRKDGEERIRKIREDRDRFLRELLRGRKSGVWRDKEGNLIVGEGTELSEEFLEGLDFDSVRPEVGWTQDGKVDGRVEEVLKLSEELIRWVNEEVEAEVEKVQHGDELPPGILQIVKVYVARKRKITVGDKMAGRHGNKGVVAKIVPEEDMPYLPDGTPVDIVLNPLGVPSRMNLGQILETHLGWAAHKLGIKVSTPVFAGATIEDVKGVLKEAGLPEDGRTVLYDGRTGEPFDRPVTVGYIYMMKLIHMAEDKIHARAIGPYSLVTQQPLGGKAQFGGQRFGEMEVWALEAYGAAYTLQEMLTVKSDDVMGRARTYEALVKGENPPEPGIPEAFKVLVREMQGLGIDIMLGDDQGEWRP